MSNVLEYIGNKLPGSDYTRPMRARRRGALFCLSAIAVSVPLLSKFTDSERVCTTTDGVATGYSGWDNGIEAIHTLREKGVYIPNVTEVTDHFDSEDIQPAEVCINDFNNTIAQNIFAKNVTVKFLP